MEDDNFMVFNDQDNAKQKTFVGCKADATGEHQGRLRACFGKDDDTDDTCIEWSNTGIASCLILHSVLRRLFV